MGAECDLPRTGPDVQADSRNINSGNVIGSLSMPSIVIAADPRGE
jgi:hypothetical protein